MGKLQIKAQSVMMGEDAMRFLAILPVIKKIDDRLDKIPADQWPEAQAELGDTPCAFLSDPKVMPDEIKAEFKQLATKYKVDEKDMWQNCNLLALQLAKIRDLAKEVRAAEALDPNNLAPRKQLVSEHEQLSILATNFMLSDYQKTAQSLRNFLAEHSADDLAGAREVAIQDRVVVTNKRLPHLESNLVEFSRMQQAVDDANDFIVDLRSEVEQGRISPNRHILAMKEQEIDPKEFLGNLKQQYPKEFAKGKLLPETALGGFAETVRADLRQHMPEIKKYAPFMAMRGFDFRAHVFPTTGADLDPNAVKVDLQGEMGWAMRLKEMATAKGNVKKLGREP